jgi:glutamate decarboxylase
LTPPRRGWPGSPDDVFALPGIQADQAHRALGHPVDRLGAGWVIWRDKGDRRKSLIFKVNYLGGNMPTFALNFSPARRADCRPVLTTTSCGWDGRVIGRSTRRDTGAHGTLRTDRQPRPVRADLRLRRRDPGRRLEAHERVPHDFSLLTGRGPGAGRCPPVRFRRTGGTWPCNASWSGFSKDLASLLLDDFRRSLGHLSEHKPSKPLSEQEGEGFHH